MTPSESWFDAGVEAANRTLPGVVPPDCYLCPICLSPYSREVIEADLSREHAPPQSVRGRRVAVTCQLCNRGAGAKLDKHLRESEDDLDARAEGRERVRWTAGNVTTVADFHVNDDGTMVIASVPHRNQPGQMQAIARAMEVVGENQGEFTITGIMEHRAVDVAWLKSAYVAAFALFGYAYVLHGKLNDVRRQIEHPSERVLEHFHLVQTAQPKERLWVRVVLEPNDFACLQVAMGRHLVLLPSIWNETDIYAKVAECKRDGLPIPAVQDGVEHQWPIRPMHLWDQGHITYPGSVGSRDVRPDLWATE